MKRVIIALLVLSLIVGMALPLLAAPKKIDGARLERGAKNVALGWTEVPDAIIKVTKDTNNPLLGITVGLVKGVLNAFARTTSGAMDVVTSPARPKVEEEAIKPEMVQVVAEVPAEGKAK